MKKKVFNIIQIGDKSNRLSRFFDIFIAIVICANTLVTFLQTFDELAILFPVFHLIEVITILIFCVEYILRIWTADYLYPDKSEFRSRLRFLISFDGIIDLLTILPFFFLSGMVIFRMLRVARIFHLFRLNARYDSFNVITTVLYEKRNQIISSVFIVLILMLASSLCMYSVEHDSQPEVFRNAFSGIWWSMSTLLTVGYGDIYPITTLGRIMAICIAYLGVGAVAIPPVSSVPASWNSTSAKAVSLILKKQIFMRSPRSSWINASPANPWKKWKWQNRSRYSSFFGGICPFCLKKIRY